MATSSENLEEFDPSSGEDWFKYVERMELYFAANGVTDTNKQQAYCKAMTKHFSPPPSEIVQWYISNTRVRKPGESVATYNAEIRVLLQYCNCGETLELMWRDRIVCGINDAQTQKHLLAVKNLTCAKQKKLLFSLKIALQGSKDIYSSLPKDPMHKVSQLQAASSSSVQCFAVVNQTKKSHSAHLKIQFAHIVTIKDTWQESVVASSQCWKMSCQLIT